MTEQDTIQCLLDGKYQGLARYGDGDFNIMRGTRDRFHLPCPSLAASLAKSLREPATGVLNCLIPPPVVPEGNLAYQRWQMYLEVNAGILPLLPDGPYGSSNISRMDSLPHLHTISWWHRVSKLWQGKDICLVSGSERSLTSLKLQESPQPPTSTVQISCPAHDNFSKIDMLIAAVLAADREVVILCAGLASRPLVHRLVPMGLKVYDLGHFGMWFSHGCPIPLVDCPR